MDFLNLLWFNCCYAVPFFGLNPRILTRLLSVNPQVVTGIIRKSFADCFTVSITVFSTSARTTMAINENVFEKSNFPAMICLE